MRQRPSRDVLVSSLCVLAAPNSNSEATSITNSPKECLITGACLRVTSYHDDDVESGTGSEEIDALNQVERRAMTG